ncbi:hypothetical protein SCACP_21300 [Sporomusa carbonis]|uniref:phage late control D family protein n=1 Tax=Sporomusa carbonis TaxID=3076075 RepID=UPI003A6F7422
MLSRRANLEILYDNKNISTYLAKYLDTFSYTDHASGKADDLQITLEDRAGLWRGDWLPDKGAVLKAALVTENFYEEGKTEKLPLGIFEVDEIESTGPPSRVTVKAVSVPVSTSLRGEEKTRAWEKTRLYLIAQDIAAGAGLEVFYDTEEDISYDRVDQTQQSDLSFLLKLCEDAGLSLKVTDKQIVIFDDAAYEKLEPVMTIKKDVALVKNYSFQSSTRELYSSCRIDYHSPKNRKSFSYTYTPPKALPTGKVLVINERVTTLAEAQRLAKKRLRQKNKDEIKASFTLMGDLKLVAGVTVRVEGYGIFDGKYFVSEASHQAGSAYTVKIDLRKVLEGY